MEAMGDLKWFDYRRFEQRVTTHRRYNRDSDTDRFLEAVKVTAKSRVQRLRQGFKLWRAQRGYGRKPVKHPDFDDVLYHEEVCFSSDRMKPLADRATEGRANPKGIPCLYLATHSEIAMSEVRPPPGSLVSLAAFEIVRDLRIVNCSLDHGSMSKLRKTLMWHDAVGGEDPGASPEEIERCVWADISEAFSRPVTATDDVAGYAPTQIIAEVFKDLGFEGVAYKSAYAKDQAKQYNFALFDLDAAVCTTRCLLFRTAYVNYKFEEAAPYSRTYYSFE